MSRWSIKWVDVYPQDSKTKVTQALNKVIAICRMVIRFKMAIIGISKIYLRLKTAQDKSFTVKLKVNSDRILTVQEEAIVGN